MAGSRKLIVEFIGDTDSLERAFRKTGNATETAGQKFAKLGKVAAIGAAAIGVAAVEIGKKFAEAAITAQEETGKLNQAFENAGLSASKMSKFVDKTEASQRKLGFTNSDTRDALTKFITAGDKGAAVTRDLGLASDYARFKGIGLADASLVLVRAHAGNMRALKSLGLSLKPVTIAMDKLKEAHKKSKKPIEDWEKAIARNKDASATYEIVAKKLQERIGGQAREFSKSAKGGMEQFHAQIFNIEETIGKKLLPTIAKVIGVLNDLLGIFTGTGSASDKFKAALERMGASGKTAARILKDLGEAWRDLKKIAEFVFNFFKPMLEAWWQQIKNIVALIDDIIHGRWKQIFGDLKAIVATALKGIVGLLLNAVKLLGTIALKIGAAIGSGILKGLESLAGKIIALIVAPINAIIRQINKLPFINIKEIGVPGAAKATGAGSSRAHTGALPPATTNLAPTPHPVTGPPIGGRGSVAITGPVTVVANNPTELLAALQRSARRQTGSRSGPFAGHTLGLT